MYLFPAPRHRRTLMAALCAGLLALPDIAHGNGSLEGMARVIDGDTIAVAGRTLRLHGIDAPELGQACSIRGRAYDCGMVARTALMDLTAGTPVACQLLDGAATLSDTEPPGPAARCAAAGYDLSEGMAYTGWALADRDATARYVRLEEDARERGRGLWKGAFVTPWDWRRGERLPDDPAKD